MKQFLIITHNDMDGAASAIMVINFLKCHYGQTVDYKVSFQKYETVDIYVEQIIDNSDKYEQIYITDISIKEYLMNDIPENMFIIDHHETANHLENHKNCIINYSGNQCGATLCYKYLMLKNGYKNVNLAKLAAVVRDYDLWWHKMPNKIAKNLNFLYYYYWGETFINRFIDGLTVFTYEEQEYIQNKWNDIKKQIKTTDFIDMFNGTSNKKLINKLCVFKLFDKDNDINELCEYALDALQYDVVLSVIPKKNKISVRASERIEKLGFNVGEMNKIINGGGGHPRAGGLNFYDDEQLLTIIQAYADKISKTVI